MKALTLLFLLTGSLLVNAQTGCFSGNCENGNGSYRWDNGDIYAGQWVNNNRTGYGRYDWADGSYYVGYFKDGMLEGEGAYYGSDGTVMTGTFENGQLVSSTAVDDVDYTEYDDYDYDSDSSTIWLNELMESLDAADEAEIAAMEKATKRDLCYTINRIINEYPNNLESIKGDKVVDAFGFSDTWYSNLIVTESISGNVMESWDHPGRNSWYNVLGAYTTKEIATTAYNGFVAQLNGCKFDAVDFVYESEVAGPDAEYDYSVTYWIPFNIKNADKQSDYLTMYAEIEMYDTVLGDGWEVTVRVRSFPAEGGESDN
jgi:hypothetical protein